MDWIALLDSHHIPFVTRSQNTKRGEISVQCPFCGDEDPSQHLGISLSTEKWGCHRNPTHRGKLPFALVAGLLGCSYQQARLTVAQYNAPDPENLDQCLTALSDEITEPTQTNPQRLDLLPEFRAIQQKGSTAKFWRYLENRGFTFVQDLLRHYDLMCCLTGKWKDRIIFPVVQDDELIAWTGRALQNPINAPRYLSSSTAIKTSVFNEDGLPGGSLLFVTEGPFDALKLDYYGRSHGARATCLFGVTMTIEQTQILNRLSKRFKRTVILFDANAIEPAFQVGEWVRGASVQQLPEGIKDPGELSSRQIGKFIAAVKEG